MLLYGASDHAKIIIDYLESQIISVPGIFDDDLIIHTAPSVGHDCIIDNFAQ